MNENILWHTHRETGVFLRALLQGFWRRDALETLADMPPERAAQGAFPPCPPTFPPATPLRALLREHADAAARLRALPEHSAFAGFLHQLCSGRELDALQELMALGLARINRLRPALTGEMLRFLAGRLYRLPLASDEETRRFLPLCRELHTFAVCAGNFIPCLTPLCLRARAQAVRLGDRNESILFDLLVGSLNVCNTERHNNPRFHALMERGRRALEDARDPELFEAAAPYLGIFHFIRGEYDRAMELFMRVSRRLRAQRQHLFEMFYVRHWSFAATNRGDADLAVTLLRSRLRQSSVRSDASLALSIRGQLASQYLRMDKPEQALEQLDLALAGISGQADITSAVTVARHLAYYHLYCGHTAAAYRVMLPPLERAVRQGYRRPVYLGGMFLELLAALDAAGLPPLPGYTFRDELERCLRGPNRLLRAAALRLRGRLHARAQAVDTALAAYRQAVALFDDIHNAVEADKTRLELAALLVDGHRDKAALLVGEAWRSCAALGERFWPQKLLRLVPDYLRGRETVVSGRALLDAYRECFSPQRPETSFETFSRMLTAESGRLLGMERTFLFHVPQPAAPPRLTAAAESGLPPLPAAAQANMAELAELVAEGGPLLLDAPAAPDAEAPRQLVGLPVDCRPHGMYVLFHAGRVRDEVRAALDERLLRDIGRVLAWSCLAVLEADRSLQQLRAGGREPAREMICVSSAMRAFLDDIDRAAGTDASILLHGESGVGKEMLARRIHEKSGRSGRLVTINMASLQDDLFESEFFGHEKGAFTGAMNSKIGLAELAENGTLFLDELTEASPRVQAKLLRVLQERTFRRVGGTQSINSNFRLVAATNRHLGEAVRQGGFRADLYYRVAVLYFRIPPLRERRGDILPLARHFLRLFAHRHRRDCVEDFSDDNRRRLEEWPWPGNVRELRNVVEQSVILSGGRTLAFHEEVCDGPRPPEAPLPARGVAPPDDAEALSLREVEKRHIIAVLESTGWRIDGRRGALSVLKISRSALYARLRKYGLHRNAVSAATDTDDESTRKA